ncbi:two component transcriptional regulator, winged helix family [Granulicella rosea]|uniref:Two component transcriptional regulator, winged helix family n=1 Tax=Granulicella rosea TaxID=474952 RepID=A0A239M7T4_9BACT|nr:response regulator transcription factor [Granulicella rosea]SNT38500.1 two component transcriptional regulator, winged helix family [Granulicella rosea]
MSQRRILIVDDEPQISRVLRTSLESSGYLVTVARDGVQALEFFERAPFDLIITDLAMPNMDGIELTRAVRVNHRTPIVVLSVRDAEAMKVTALDEGADDYITKPFSIQELLARVRVHLRRTEAAPAQPQLATIETGDFSIDIDKHQVMVSGVEVHLTPKEFDLLVFFARSPYRVLTHKVLLRAIWGPSGDNQPEYLRVLVAQLRKKIEPVAPGKVEPRYIRNEPWVGYRFTPEGNAAEA